MSDFSQITVDQVRGYWDQRPCNIRHSPKPVGTREYFDEVEARKYFVEPHIPRFAEFDRWQGQKVLEIGCGIGTDTVNFARHGATVTAVDLSPQSLDLARRRVEVYGLQNQVRFYSGSAEELTSFVPVEPYDLIYSFGVIHHTPHPGRVLQQMRSYAKPGTTIKINYTLGVGMEGENPADDTPEARAKSIKEAADAAAQSDIAVVVVGRYSKIEGEGFDLKTMDLPAGQDDLIAAVEKANPHTIVVLNTGDPVTIKPDIAKAPGLLDMFYGGEEGGHALAAILFGDANPSGKLPVTLPKHFEDSPAYGRYPGENLKVDYAEGIYVGYRYYDTKKVEPAFPFGFGLSYTKFEYSNFQVAEVAQIGGGDPARAYSATLMIKNTGTRAGAEVIQLYIHPLHSKIDRPVRELKGFGRVTLKPGEARFVHFNISRSALSYWSPEKKDWVADPGGYDVEVSSSSRDIRAQAPLVLRP